MKRYTTADGLPANNIPYFTAVGNFLYMSCTGFGLVRFDTTNSAIVNYSPTSGNYSGDALPATPLLVVYGVEDNVLCFNTAGAKWRFSLTGLISVKIPATLGSSITFDNLAVRVNTNGGYYMTTGADQKGVELHEYLTEAPYYVRFNGYGFGYDFQDGEENNLNAFNFIHKKLFDQYKFSTDFSLGQLFKLSFLQAVNGDARVVAGVFTVDEDKDRGAIIRFNSASDVDLELAADTNNNGLVFTIVQLGAGLLHIVPIGGASAVGKLSTAGVNDSLSILDLDGLGTNFLGR